MTSYFPLKSIETASRENKPFLRKYNSNDNDDGFRDSHDHDDDDDNDDEDYGNGNYDDNKRFQSKYYDSNSKYLSPWKLQNTGILGFAMYFSGTPVNYYLVEELGASSVYIAVLGTLQSLPWSFKIFYGLLSDTVPILGYKRKPYLFLGWCVYIVTNFILSSLVRPGITTTIIGFFIITCGLLLADVATDTLAVERSKLESESEKGNLQSLAYTYRAVGMILGAVAGAVLYNKKQWNWGLSIAEILALNGLFPLMVIIPLAFPLVELAYTNTNDSNNNSIRGQLKSLWKLLCLKAVWKPMIFIYIYNVLQIPNPSWYNFLVEGLHFTNFQLGLITISSAIMTWFGLVIYKKYLFKASWRIVYILTTGLGLLFSILQLFLVYGINERLGIPSWMFALGDSTFASFVGAIQYLPTLIMYVVLCPEGSEGTSYALLTTISNLAGTVGSDISSWLTNIWDTKNETLQAGDYRGVANLAILTSVLQILPIVLVGLLPRTREEQITLRDSGQSNFYGGFFLSITVISSLIFTVGLNIYLLL